MICDLAQVYQIFDYRRVPVRLLATLTTGLDENTRIGKIKDGRKVTVEAYFIAELCDLLEVLIMGMAGQKAKPERTAALMRQNQFTNETGMTPDEYERFRAGFMRKK